MTRHVASPGASPAWIVLAVAFATALHLPSLGAGFFVDDSTHQIVLDGRHEVPSLRPWALFDFGEASAWAGLDAPPWTLPWWTSADFKGRFFRPLTSLTLWLDHALYGTAAVGYHATSLLWYLAVLVLTVGVYRALGLGRGATALAVVLLAGTNGAVLPVGWIANRNTVVAAAFVLAAVLVVVRGGRRWRLPVALGLGLLAVGGKESGVLAFALVAAWFLLEAHRAVDPATRRRCVASAATAAAVALAVIGALAAAGYGTRSVFYATPWADPGRYLAHLAVLFTAGGLRLLAPVSLDLAMLYRQTLPVVMAVGAASVALVTWAFGRRVAGHPAASFLAAWVVLALLPQGGAMPSDRLLFDAAVGSAGLLALAITRTLGGASGAGRPLRVGAAVLLLSAGVLGPVVVGVVAAAMPGMSDRLRAAILATEVGPPGRGVVDAVVLQSGTTLMAFSLAPTWAVETGRTDVRFTFVQYAGEPLVWTRDGPRSCTLRSIGGPLLGSPFEQVFRSRPEPPGPGERLRGVAVDVTPLEVDGDGLRAIRLELRRSLDHPDVRFLVPDANGLLRPHRVPAPGETVILPRPVPAVPPLP